MHTIEEMRDRAEGLRIEGKTISFVPTMGYLHEGHLSLLRIARQKGDDLALSIFVNPAQFGPNEDLSTYPRSLEKDLELAEKEGVDVVFVPMDSSLYPEGYQTYVELEKLPAHLCGLSRPVFFKGIATVVTQLFNIVKPHVAVFGEKDFQQLAIIRQMVKDLKFDIEIIGGPIIREADGLAMSSRNAYLDESMRPAALSLSRALARAKEMVRSGIIDSERIEREARAILSAFPDIAIDYISICDPFSLDGVQQVRGKTLMALAVNLRKIRLIDNTVLDPES
nr:pantoate--beta-alanine ligase [Desulfomarina profundi]